MARFLTILQDNKFYEILRAKALRMTRVERGEKMPIYLPLRMTRDEEIGIKPNIYPRSDRRGFDNSFMKKAAFTLAEVLITIGVIGIVAAITIPNLITKYQEKVTITKLQQTYSILSQGFRRMIAENGTVDTWGEDSESKKTRINELFPQYIQTSIIYPTGRHGLYVKPLGITGVFDSNGVRVGSFPGNTKDYLVYTLPNSSVVVIQVVGSCIQDMTLLKSVKTSYGLIHYGTHAHACGTIQVALNAKPKILSNKDLFMFKIVTDGVVPAGTSKESVWGEQFEQVCIKENSSSPGRCTAWVLENKNMDYLRCPEKLGWNKARSCGGK